MMSALFLRIDIRSYEGVGAVSVNSPSWLVHLAVCGFEQGFGERAL